MKLPRKTLEKKLFADGYRLIYAVDEVGMGCLAGPVVVCAVAMTNQFYKKTHKKLRWIRDSKLLQAKQREVFSAELLKEKDLVYAVSFCSPKIIDKINIYNAARLAMRRAIARLAICYKLQALSKNLKSLQHKTYSLKIKSIVLIDGPYKISKINLEQMPIVKGDRKVFAIACASIIAKVYRDKMMIRYAKKYSGYGFEKHKGYGTKLHQAQLTVLGPCAIHRRSFRLEY